MRKRIIYANLTYIKEVKVKNQKVMQEITLNEIVFTEGKTEYYIKETKETVQIVKVEVLKILSE